METKDIALAKFKITLYELETFLSMSPLYHMEHEEVLKRLSDVNETLENLNKEFHIQASPILEDFPRIKTSFQSNNIAIFEAN